MAAMCQRVLLVSTGPHSDYILPKPLSKRPPKVISNVRTFVTRVTCASSRDIVTFQDFAHPMLSHD
jgi:hypothetical protein